MRFIIGIFITIGLIVLILVLLLRGGGGTPTPKALKLSDYANSGSTAHYILDGPIVSDQEHQGVKIDVSADEVSFMLYRGYEGDVIKQQTYLNNKSAYTVFLKALQQSGFTKGNVSTALQDERGHCPNGQRRIYAFTNDSDVLMRFWSTNCGEKTFAGSIGSVDELFRRQVPDYNTLIQNSTVNNGDLGL
jgi:hypothetical protein